ncbi:MAG: TolC family protein [Bacillota bacterium]
MYRILTVLISIMLLSGLWVPGVWAKEAATPEIGLNEAISIAINKSNTLKKVNLEIDKAYENRQEADDELDYTPVPGNIYNPMVGAAWYSLLSHDLSWQMSKRNYIVEEDRIVLETCQKYWNVLVAQEKYKVSKHNLKKSEIELANIRALVNVGMAPQGMSPAMAIKQAEGKKAASFAAYVTAENELSKAYEALNKLIGLWPEDRPILKDNILFTPLEDVALDAHVRSVLDHSPSVWLAEEAVSMAKYAQSMMFAMGKYTPYEVRKIEVQQAELDSMNARDAIRMATREMYYALRNIEEAYASTEKGIQTAQEALRVIKLLYEVGMATELDVVQAEEALAEVKQGLVDLSAQHAYLKMAFQKPWAISRN